MHKAITMKELQKIVQTMWIRPKKQDDLLNKHFITPRFNLTLIYQDEWCFVCGSFLLNVNSSEYAESPESKNWTSIQLIGH